MAENFANHIVQIPIIHKDFLGQIRHWDNLKVATEASNIWVKNFTEIQLESIELSTIPFTKTYICKDNLLFPEGSLLPLKKMPNLLWTPIERALNINLTNFNHNFFGIKQSIDITLKAIENEHKATILLVKTALANDYIVNASAIRLKPLRWVLIDADYALIFGEPMLPINGNAYWQTGNFVFPLGFHLEFPILEKMIEKKINLIENQLIWWFSEKNYSLLDQYMFKPLSIASWKQTLNID